MFLSLASYRIPFTHDQVHSVEMKKGAAIMKFELSNDYKELWITVAYLCEKTEEEHPQETRNFCIVSDRNFKVFSIGDFQRINVAGEVPFPYEGMPGGAPYTILELFKN